jgi:hypothetical protein
MKSHGHGLKHCGFFERESLRKAIDGACRNHHKLGKGSGATVVAAGNTQDFTVVAEIEHIERGFIIVTQQMLVIAVVARERGGQQMLGVDRPMESTDLVPTIGAMLDFSPTLARGKPIPELA